MVERRFPKPNVEGSSPSGRVCFIYTIIFDLKRYFCIIYIGEIYL